MSVSRGAVGAFAFLLVFGLACHDEGRPDGGSSTGGAGPDFTVCASCPVGVPGVCPAGQVCAVPTPGLGGYCVLACSDDEGVLWRKMERRKMVLKREGPDGRSW